ncbi:B12-binding domain-containing radical SAM protein [Acidobacteriota bacterium]
MKILLTYPTFPQTFYSFEKILKLVNRKALQPPLGLITAAALLPGEWELKLVDCNVRSIKEEEWQWAEVVMISAMIVQKSGFFALIKEAKERGKPVVVGGPYPTSLPEEAKAAGADYIIMDEAEVTLPLFLDSFSKGKKQGVFQAGGRRPDLTTTPVPRFDLLQMDAYDAMSIQFSRGCPFKCEFCDITYLYGREPRTKKPEQVLMELDYLYDIGWRGSMFIVDDNFIGHKRQAMMLLKKLKTWQAEHRYPFWFDIQASVDLAGKPEMMRLMKECDFTGVCLGIESLEKESLKKTGKTQNITRPLAEVVEKITRAGLRPMAGFILGFDGEKPGADTRIIEFIEKTAIPTATISLLQALPNTALRQRLEREGRLLEGDANLNQTTMLNFIPTRPPEEIAAEFIRAYSELYDPLIFLDRTYRCFLKLAPPVVKTPFTFPSLIELRAFFIIIWRQGIKRKTRWKFWHHFFGMIKNNSGVLNHYISVCAHIEHYLEYRKTVKQEIETQLKTNR